MDMMNNIAATGMQMSAADFGQSYSMSVMKKAMDLSGQTAELLADMLPAAAAIPKGQYIDVYA